MVKGRLRAVKVKLELELNSRGTLVFEYIGTCYPIYLDGEMLFGRYKQMRYIVFYCKTIGKYNLVRVDMSSQNVLFG